MLDSLCTNLLNSDFYKDILAGKDSDYLLEKYILHNVPYYFKNNMDLFFDIKKKIATRYNIPITNIYLTGSGQLGFSLNPNKGYRNFIFDEDTSTGVSDLDFAIISTKLFDEFWDEICEYRRSDLTLSPQEEKNCKKFQDYLFWGWIRPDKFPVNYPKKKEWFEFFNSINPLVNRQVACGIFRNEHSFMKYYCRTIDELINLTKEV